MDHHELSQLTADQLESRHVTALQPESQHATVDHHELSQLTADQPESRHVTADQPESRHVTADQPESRHVTADQPESRHVTADQPESRHVTADQPESRHVTADQPEPIPPRDLRSILRVLRLISSVRDAPLVSVRTAGIPKSTHFDPPAPELITLSEALPRMGIALCCIWAAYTSSELPQGMAPAAAPPEVAAHAATSPSGGARLRPLQGGGAQQYTLSRSCYHRRTSRGVGGILL